MAYAEATNALIQLAGDESGDEVRTALEAASSEIDAAFSKAGYTTPIDLSLIADATVRTRFSAKLAITCQALAGGMLATVPSKNRGPTSKSKKDRDIAREWLASIASRQISYGFLGRSKSAGFKVVGSSTWKPTEERIDSYLGAFDNG